jgi:uncharacterized protein (DUF849 family)
MAKISSKRIVTCSVTGSVHTPTMSDYLPITPKQISDEALAAANAGAAVVHLHARDPENGAPTPDLKVFREIVDLIRAKNKDLILCITTGGNAATMTPDERISGVPHFKPELASCNAGSINWGTFALMEKYNEDFKYQWERDMLNLFPDFVFKNTFADLMRVTKVMAEYGTKPEFEAYDIGHLYNIQWLLQNGYTKAPVYIQFCTGILGGIGATCYDIMNMHQTADRLFGGGNYIWSAFGAGRFDYPVCTQSLLLGGNVRIGMEDNLMLGRGRMAKSNGELVEKMIRIMRELDLEPASPSEAREILQLKEPSA